MMDISFDAFAGDSGWDEQAELERNAVANTQRLNPYEKIPIPVSIAELLKMENGDDKLRIGTFTFNTIKVIGRVVNIQSDQDQTCITYELNDCSQADVKMAPSFTVIRYHGVDSRPKDETFHEGKFVSAVGKLRLFNSRLSLASFHITEVENTEEIELYQLEAKLAYLFYSKNIPERTIQQVDSIGVPFFSYHAPVRGATGASQTSGRHNSQGVNSGNATGHRLYQQEPTNNRGLSGQQAMIYEYIKQNSATGSGVSVDEIRGAIKTDAKFSAHLNFLLGEGVIYNTVDDNHFAVIE